MTGGHAFTRGMRAEINIAPLVDVAMVLLIIFMAAAPMLQTGYDVAMPRPAAGPSADPVSVTLDDAGNVLVNGEPVDKSALQATLSALIAGRATSVVFFDAGDRVTYADAVDILDLIRRAGARMGIKLDSVRQAEID
jgi:biopolymer transport protein TolR